MSQKFVGPDANPFRPITPAELVEASAAELAEKEATRDRLGKVAEVFDTLADAAANTPVHTEPAKDKP